MDQEKLIKLAEKGGSDKDLLFLDEINSVKEKVVAFEQKLESGFSSISEELKKKLESELVLEINRDELKGERGEQGIHGLPGNDGLPGKDGTNGRDGLNGKDGIDGKNGADGLNGKDGSPDTPDQTVEKVNLSKNLIKKERVEGLADIENIAKLNAFNPTMGPSFSDLATINKRIDSLGGGAVSSVSNSDGLLTASPTTGAVLVTLPHSGNNITIGSATTHADRVYFGNGSSAASPTATSLNGTDGLGNNVAGGSISMVPGLSTGSASPAAFNIKTSTVGSSGSTPQSAVTRFSVDGSKISFAFPFLPDGNATRDIGSASNNVNNIYTTTIGNGAFGGSLSLTSNVLAQSYNITQVGTLGVGTVNATNINTSADIAFQTDNVSNVGTQSIPAANIWTHISNVETLQSIHGAGMGSITVNNSLELSNTYAISDALQVLINPGGSNTLALSVYPYAGGGTDQAQFHDTMGSVVASIDSSGGFHVPAFQLGTSATSGYVLTTDSSGNGAWQAPTSGSSITLQTNGSNNGSQSLLNLVPGTNITLTDNGSGNVTIDGSTPNLNAVLTSGSTGSGQTINGVLGIGSAGAGSTFVLSSDGSTGVIQIGAVNNETVKITAGDRGGSPSNPLTISKWETVLDNSNGTYFRPLYQ